LAHHRFIGFDLRLDLSLGHAGFGALPDARMLKPKEETKQALRNDTRVAESLELCMPWQNLAPFATKGLIRRLKRGK
jgi:hypothetical protein